MRRSPFGPTAVLMFLVAGLTSGCGDSPTEVALPQEGAVRAGPAISFATADNGAGLSITTDKDDYAPGDTVWFTGAGWQPGDTLDIVLADEPATHPPHTWSVVVDQAGEFRDSTYVVDVDDVGVTFTLTATGRVTGESLTVTFTDGNVKFITSPANLVASITYSRWNGSSTCSGTPSSTGTGLAYNTNLGLQATQSIRFTVPSVTGYAYTGYSAPSLTVSPASSPAATTLCVTGLSGSASGTLTLNFVLSNTKPTARFTGTPYTTSEGSVKQLDGSASSDPEDGTNITYLWSVDVTDGTPPYVPIDAFGECKFYTTNNASDVGTTTSTLQQPYIKCTDDGVFKLTLVVTDQGTPPLSSDPATTTLTVSNVAPTITAVTVTPSVSGNLYSISSQPMIGATYTDPGTNDTHTCTFEVFDYLNLEVGTDRSCGSALGVLEAGVYVVEVTVADDDGGADEESVQIVIYDPSAGFVTGGGWIYSAAGAYKDDLSLAGKGTFGFVSKYQKGANVPTGNTQFVFHADGANGNALDFHSTSYQWLVVNGVGTRAQYKGSGAVAGRSESFTFMLTAIDGSPDQFRIQIFRPDGTTLYDNYVSGPATEQPLGGGSIVIHTSKK